MRGDSLGVEARHAASLVVKNPTIPATPSIRMRALKRSPARQTKDAPAIGPVLQRFLLNAPKDPTHEG